MKTKGALLRNFNEKWAVEEIEIGDPRKGEVKIRMEAAGMCHSDHHLMTGGIPMAGFPVLGGHEGAGIVEELGEGVTDFQVGDHVVLSFIPSCGKCPSCRSGLSNLCDMGAMLLQGEAVSDHTFRVHTAAGENVYPMTLLGTFAPYMVVHETSVVKIDPSIPFEVACLVGCGVPTGFGSATHSAKVQPGEDVAIVGIGGVGISALQGTVISGARYIFAIDPIEWKREQALKFGATHAFASVEEAAMTIAELTEGQMAKKVIVTVGEVHGKDVDLWMGITAKAGTCVLTGMGSMMESDVTLNLAMLTLLQKNLQGTIFGGASPKLDIPQLLSLYKMGKLNLDDMVTRQYRLDQINEGYQDMLDGKNIRGVIRFTDEDH
ncbi:MAG: NDMA-dependent alcohol dehydrogenase [Gordonia sp.]|jgi:S-(hydroxymethyl)glutathione dehydrogenase/alcohol dehydrogenase|uniref:alcohol dehydrogenase n=1 Tax=Gordonia rubripertincta TaxID=36822 RepID=A0ABT4MPQ3_GORRU|nr:MULTISPECIES: NDMA-dependent alcohol dehydrogenase [Mycobacteriales]MBA4025958.1 NDMA-dependent alcohol dehydrogenase [Gordonia sp. (in: high G+C Gram-positive bacteria)]MCZ4548974.1 NDMA-dependent alcohol dehydrogenase [Gordonia rubripertincta]OZG30108.1 NDMA-dependent alcohol dehydrogenase [Williamsia sp. 1138]